MLVGTKKTTTKKDGKVSKTLHLYNDCCVDVGSVKLELNNKISMHTKNDSE